MLSVVINTVVIIPLLLMAVMFLKGRGASLLAGYNTLNPQEQAKYDVKAMLRATGWMLISVCLCIVFMTAGIYFYLEWLVYTSAIIKVTIILGFVLYANTGGRFRR